jgi:hypothetical protein
MVEGILGISYIELVSNKEVHHRIQQLLSLSKDWLRTIMKCEIKWYRYVSRSSDLAKTILQSTVPGKQKQIRQIKRWEGKIREWTVLNFSTPQKAALDRKDWKKIVLKSSRATKRPLWLRS